MAVQVQMPALGESVTEGTVLRWLKKEGEPVQEGEPLLEVATDKVDTEIPSPVTGIVRKIVADEDATIAVGGELAVVDENTTPAEPAPLTRTEKPVEPKQPAVGGTGSAVFATPVVRALAAAHGVDLPALAGSGPGGRIRKQDVLAAAGAEPWRPSPPSTPPHRPQAAPAGVRTAVSAPPAVAPAEATSPSRALTTLQQEADVTKLVALRDQFASSFAASERTDLTLLTFLAKAVVEAVRTTPSISPASASAGAVHLGVITDGDPANPVVIEHAEQLNITGLARARASSDVTETFSITAVHGDAAALADIPVLAAGKPASLGAGAVVKRPRIVSGPNGEDTITISSVCTLSLTVDAHLIDRNTAGRFLAAVTKRLEQARFEADLRR